MKAAKQARSPPFRLGEVDGQQLRESGHVGMEETQEPVHLLSLGLASFAKVAEEAGNSENDRAEVLLATRHAKGGVGVYFSLTPSQVWPARKNFAVLFIST